MITLEFLGLDASGNKLTFNDADGNRYEVSVCDEIRAALRKDIDFSEPLQELKPASPREIQSYFRQGKTINEVAELCALPPSQLTRLATPIFAERQYVAQSARKYMQTADNEGMTVEELVVSRLIGRKADADTLTWDAVRKADAPWTLIARYTAEGKRCCAQWSVSQRAKTLRALNEEAIALTETPLAAPSSAWHPLHAPQPGTPVQATPITAAHTEPQQHTDTPETQEHPDVSADSPVSAKNVDIDAVLASLDTQRGVSRPMPKDDFLDGAHPASSEPERATDARILSFPARHTADTQDADSSGENPQKPLPGLTEDNGQAEKQPKTQKPKTKRDRPAMPSWDEIVFGSPKSDEH